MNDEINLESIASQFVRDEQIIRSYIVQEFVSQGFTAQQIADRLNKIKIIWDVDEGGNLRVTWDAGE